MVSIRSWQRLTLRGSTTSWPVPYLETGRREKPRRYQRLAVLRAEQGLSRQELASTLGTDYQTVGYLERGADNRSRVSSAGRHSAGCPRSSMVTERASRARCRPSRCAPT
jgi:hypothetical protein